jgi:hypothetical protein
MSTNESSFFMEIFKPMVSAAMQNAFVNGQPQQQQQPANQQQPWQQQQWHPRGQRGFNGSYGNGQQRGPSLTDKVDKLIELQSKQLQPQLQQQPVPQPVMQPAGMQYPAQPVQMQQSPLSQPGFVSSILQQPPPQQAPVSQEQQIIQAVVEKLQPQIGSYVDAQIGELSKHFTGEIKKVENLVHHAIADHRRLNSKVADAVDAQMELTRRVSRNSTDINGLCPQVSALSSQDRDERTWGLSLLKRQVSGVKRAVTELAQEVNCTEALKRIKAMEEADEHINWNDQIQAAANEEEEEGADHEDDGGVVNLPRPPQAKAPRAPRAVGGRGTGSKSQRKPGPKTPTAQANGQASMPDSTFDVDGDDA